MTRRDTVTSWIIVVLLLLGGAAIVSRLPDADEIRKAEFEREGAPGRSVALRSGTVRLVGVHGGKQFRAPPFEQVPLVRSTNGVFVLPTIEISGSEGNAHFTGITLETADGRVFGGSARTIALNGCGPAPAGLPVRCQLIFEADPAALAGARLHVPGDGAGDDVAVLDLGITAERARSFVNNDVPMTIERRQDSWEG